MLSTPPRPGSSPPTTPTTTPPRTYTFVTGTLLERVARNDPCCTMAHVSSSSSSLGGPSCLEHEGARQWAYALSHNTKLVVLGLTQTHLPPGDSAAWHALAEALAQHPRLEYLTLKYNPQLGSPGLSVLAQALCRSTTSSRLRVLNVAHCQVGDEACVDLAAWLSSKDCRLERLDVQHNDIGPVGLTALARALPTCRTLQRVELQGNTRLETAQHVHVQEPCTYRRRCPFNSAPKTEPQQQSTISMPPPPLLLSIPPPLPHSHVRSTSIQSVSSSTSSEASTATTSSSNSSRHRSHHSSPMCRAWQALDQALSSSEDHDKDNTTGHSYNISLVALEFDWHSDTGGRTNTNTATNAIPTTTTTRTALRCTCPYQARVHIALTLNRWGRRYFHGSRCCSSNSSNNSNSTPLPLEQPGPESTTTTTATTTPTGITAWAWTRVLAKPSHAGSAHHSTTRCRGPVQTLPTRCRSTTTTTTSNAEPTIWSVSLLYALVRVRPELLVQHRPPPPPSMTRHKVATTTTGANPMTVPDTSLESPSPLAWCTPPSFHYQDEKEDDEEEDGWFIEDNDEERDSELWNTTTPSPLGCSTPWPLTHSSSPAPSVGTPLGSATCGSPTTVSPGSERIVKKSRMEQPAPSQQQDNDNHANGTAHVPDLAAAAPPRSFLAPQWD